jgi:hypothetical protein
LANYHILWPPASCPSKESESIMNIPTVYLFQVLETLMPTYQLGLYQTFKEWVLFLTTCMALVSLALILHYTCLCVCVCVCVCFICTWLSLDSTLFCSSKTSVLW